MGLENIVKIIFQGENQTQQGASGAVGSIKSVASAATALSAEFLAIKYAVKEAFDMVEAVVKPGFDAINEYQNTVIKTAALITSFQGGNDIAATYAKAKDYAGALQDKLLEINANVFMNQQELSMVTEEMLKQRVLLDINNQKQVEGFQNIANAAAVVAAGSGNKEIQIRQEIRALMQGEVNMMSQLASEVNAMVGGGLKEKVEQWKKEGTLIEHIGELLRGYAAASGDISSTWGAIKTTIESMTNKILRAGFGDIFKDIIAGAQGVGEWMKANADTIGNVIRKIWLVVKGVFEALFIWNSQLFQTASPILKLVAMILDTAGRIVYVVIPEAAGRLVAVVRIVTAIIETLIAMGQILLDIGGIIGKTFYGVGRILWNALTGDKEGLKKAMEDFAKESLGEPFKKHIAEIGDRMKVIGKEGTKIFDVSGLKRRNAEWDKNLGAKKFTNIEVPILPPAPMTDDEKAQARARIDAALKVELEAMKEALAQRVEALKTQEKELDVAYKTGNLSEKDYLDQKTALEKTALDATIGVLDMEKAAIARANAAKQGLYKEEKDRIKEQGDAKAEQLKRDSEIAKKQEEERRLELERRAQDPKYNPVMGAKKALQDYADMAAQTGKQVQDAITHSLRSIEDAFVKFAMTAKFSFKDMANSIIADMVRIMVQRTITGPLANFLGGLLPSATPVAGGRASGGLVYAGSTYLVGERGPELFTPSTTGSIIPNHALGGGGNVDVLVTIENKTGAPVKASQSGMQFDGKRWVKGITLELAATDPDYRNTHNIGG